MKKVLCLLAVILFAGSTLSLLGQNSPDPINWVIRIKVQSGKDQAFEEAYKQHLKWHADNNDSMPWHGWQYIAGPYTGEYVIAVPGQEWKNFDRGDMGKADSANARQTVGPHILERQVWYSQTHRNLSSLQAEGASMPAMATVYRYHLKPGHRSQFVSAISRMHKALQEGGWGKPYRWNEVVEGGEGLQFYVVVPRESFADFADPEPSLLEVVEGKLGRAVTEDIRNDFWGAVNNIDSHVLVYREDLSYVP